MQEDLPKSENEHSSTTTTINAARLFTLQREARSSLIKSYIELNGTSNVHPATASSSGLLARNKQTVRTRKQLKKDVKLWEKELKKKKADINETKHRKYQDFLKLLMAHRDEFTLFQKMKRSEASKMAKYKI